MSAAQQAALWGRRPRDWARLAEPQNVVLFDAVLDALDVREGLRVLDCGCGSGLAAEMARARGAVVGGVDITPELLEVARERVPDGEFLVGSLDALPLEDGSYDVAFGVNAFQFADDPVGALREAARVAPGLVAITTFAEPERCESTALHLAMKNAVDPTADGYAPYSLSAPGKLEELLSEAGLEPVERGEVPVVWRHDDVENTILSLLCSGGGARTMDGIGEAAVREALAPAIAPFVQADGSVSMNNVFRYAVGKVTA